MNLFNTFIHTNTARSCGDLTAPENGIVLYHVYQNGTVVGDTAVFSCNNGYTLNGDENAICLSNGSWYYGTPECNLGI